MFKRCAVLGAVGAMVFVMACSSCSSGGSGNDGGTSGGMCKHVVVCMVIPGTTITSQIGLMVTNANPTSADTPITDECVYISSDPGKNATVNRQCFDDASSATSFYGSTKNAPLKTGGTRNDVSGLGDQAFYQSEPTSTMGVNKVRLVTVKGQVMLSLEDVYVATADDAKVKSGLTSIANTLFAQ